MEKITEKKKELLREFVDRMCENCHKSELDLSCESNKIVKLHIHRIKRGRDGGTYTLNNLKVLCPDCHKIFHSNEMSNCKSK